MEKSLTLTILSRIKLNTSKAGVKSLLFCYVCLLLSDRSKKWSDKDGF